MTDHRAIVENTDLPRRLKERVYETVTDKGADADQAKDIAKAVESQYLDVRVDPLDPVGTVSAQSIGEPGTQMSIPADERVLVRQDGQTATRAIGPLVDGLCERLPTRTTDDHEVARLPESIDLAVPSLDASEDVAWQPVEEVSRHEAPDELLEFHLASGRRVSATKAHSFVTRREDEVVPVAGERLSAGDWLPVVRRFGAGEARSPALLGADTERAAALPARPLSDGGALTARSPAPDELSATGGIGLDATGGFLLGAWLGTGTLEAGRASFHDLDPAVAERLRAIARDRGLALGATETASTVAIESSALVEALEQTALADGEKCVPGPLYGAEETTVRGLLAGYCSTAGSAGERTFGLTVPTRRLATGLGLVLARVGVHASVELPADGTLAISGADLRRLESVLELAGERAPALATLAAQAGESAPGEDVVPNFGETLASAAESVGYEDPAIAAATASQTVDRAELERLLAALDDGEAPPAELAGLRAALTGDVVWDRIERVETVTTAAPYVYDLSVAGLETFTTAEGVVTHNTMNTFHYAGVAEIDVTQGLPRLIELVDARKTPDTPMMTVYVDEEYVADRIAEEGEEYTERDAAHEVVWQIEATKILQLGDVSTNVADMLVEIDLNEETLAERWPRVADNEEVAAEIAGTIESSLGVDAVRPEPMVIQFGPEQPSYRELLQLVEELRDIVFKGIEAVTRVVIRKDETDEGEEFILYTEGSAFKKAVEIDGVDATRTTCNNIHEIYRTLGIEAARETAISETMDTLEEQGLDDVNVRHLMLVADIMTNRGEIESIGRHGISGNKESVLARAAFEVTVNHLMDAAIHGEVDGLDGVTENVIVGKPIRLGTGDVDIRMGTADNERSTSDD